MGRLPLENKILVIIMFQWFINIVNSIKSLFTTKNKIEYRERSNALSNLSSPINNSSPVGQYLLKDYNMLEDVPLEYSESSDDFEYNSLFEPVI